MFEEQSFDQSASIKLTEELLRTKKVGRRKKVLAGKEHASIQAMAKFLVETSYPSDG